MSTKASRGAVNARSLHEQESDLALLLRLFERLSERTVIDVGAEKGAFAEAFLAAGCSRIWAFEPFPSHAAHLRERFDGNTRITVLEMAIGARDETCDLHIAENRAGQEYPYYHSLARFADTPEIRWARRLLVTCRSLGSLVEDGSLPPEVGVLKIDTEGHDLAVLQGMGRLSPAVVMVEFWDSIPMLGTCAYSLGELASALAMRGYPSGLVVRRHEGFEILQVGAFATRAGDWGNAIFVHERVWPALAPLLDEAAAQSQISLVNTAVDLRKHADHRLDVIKALQDDRLLSLSRFLRPRLGNLRHHPPRALEIPDSYRSEPPVAPEPVISIVTPTMNSVRFVERTIQSVLDQGYGRLEYILKDGDSTDGTLDVLERYRSRLAAVAVGKDSGQSGALNHGFASTTGEIMAYLNSDDLLLPGTLRYVARYFATHPHVDVVYGHRILIDENDHEIGRWVLPPHENGILSWADYVPQETLFWRRRIWERAGGRIDDSFHMAMDWDLLLRFRDAKARFVRLPRFLGAFRVHEDQKTSARLHDVGVREMARLRQRVHGRTIAPSELRWRVRGYLLRHMVYQKLYRAGLLRY